MEECSHVAACGGIQFRLHFNNGYRDCETRPTAASAARAAASSSAAQPPPAVPRGLRRRRRAALTPVKAEDVHNQSIDGTTPSGTQAAVRHHQHQHQHQHQCQETAVLPRLLPRPMESVTVQDDAEASEQ